MITAMEEISGRKEQLAITVNNGINGYSWP
jgi:hypothetical protein